MKACPKCGSEFPDEYAFCAQCASPLSPKEAAAPSVAEARRTTAVLGSLAARLVAHLIDLLVLLLAFWLVGNVYGSLFGGLTPTGFNLTKLPALVIIGVAGVIFLAYLILFEALLGATPGKFLLGLRVRAVSQAPCSFNQAAIRNLLRIVDALPVYLVGLIALLATKQKQRVGDVAARTIVVNEPPGWAKRVGAVIFLLACIVGTVLGTLWVRHHPRVRPVTFAIVNLRFADSESAPPRASIEYRPEEEARLFYEVPGYERDADSNIAVVTQNQVFAPDGKPFYEPKTVETKQRVGDDAGPVKIHFSIGLPPWSPPGKYTVRIQAKDQVARKTATAETSFRVNAPPIESSTGFVATHIELAASRDGAPVNPPAFTAGQSIWLRFRMQGMKAGEKGEILLTEDWGVIGPDGTPVFERTDDSVVNEQYVYPPPFYPYREYVTLPSSAPPGGYRFHVVLHDKIAGADFSIDQPFTIAKP